MLDVLAHSSSVVTHDSVTADRAVAGTAGPQPTIRPRSNPFDHEPTARTAALPDLRQRQIPVAATPDVDQMPPTPEPAPTSLSEPESAAANMAQILPDPGFDLPPALESLPEPLESPTPTTNTSKIAQETESASLASDERTPEQRQLDARAERDGLLGFCPVTLREERKLADGRPEFSTLYESQEYCFATREAKAAFDATPERFVPANGGHDIVLAAGKIRVRGSLRHATYFENRLYLFRSEQTHRLFEADPARYVPDRSQSAE